MGCVATISCLYLSVLWKINVIIIIFVIANFYLSASYNPTFFQHGKSLLLLASKKNPPASAVATDSAVADVIATISVPWVPSVLQWSLLLLASLLLLLFLLLFTSQEYTCCG